MNDTLNTFPVGIEILGRVLNTNGEPIDKKGPLTNVQRVPILKHVSDNAIYEVNKNKTQVDQIWETGIKVLDLLAPLPCRGVVGIFGNTGVGKLVVTEELMHNFITTNNGYIVCLSMDESSFEVSELMDLIREGELEEKVVMLFEQMTDSLEIRLNMLRAGFTVARHFKQQGHNVLLVMDANITAINEQVPSIIGELKQMLKKDEITVILLKREEDSMLFKVGDAADDLDCQIVLTPKLADQNLWPAIDRLLSNSQLLKSSAASDEHKQVAEKTRELLLHSAESEMLDQQGLLEADRQEFKGALRIQKFFTQPFFIAEAYTEIPGEYVKVEETVKDFKDLLDGQFDDLPEQAFYFVGGIDEAVAKSHTSLS